MLSFNVKDVCRKLIVVDILNNFSKTSQKCNYNIGKKNVNEIECFAVRLNSSGRAPVNTVMNLQVT